LEDEESEEDPDAGAVEALSFDDDPSLDEPLSFDASPLAEDPLSVLGLAPPLPLA